MCVSSLCPRWSSLGGKSLALCETQRGAGDYFDAVSANPLPSVQMSSSHYFIIIILQINTHHDTRATCARQTRVGGSYFCDRKRQSNFHAILWEPTVASLGASDERMRAAEDSRGCASTRVRTRDRTCTRNNAVLKEVFSCFHTNCLLSVLDIIGKDAQNIFLANICSVAQVACFIVALSVVFRGNLGIQSSRESTIRSYRSYSYRLFP